MATRNLRTANYSEEARRALGDAVASARRAAGFQWRTEFARRHEKVSVSSLKLIEQGKPLVGVAALQAVGRALGEHFPGRWTGDTPRAILEGSPAPIVGPPAATTSTTVDKSRVSAVITASPDDPEFWVALRDEVPDEAFQKLWKLYQERKRANGA